MYRINRAANKTVMFVTSEQVLVAVLPFLAAASLLAAPFEIARSTIDGGGAMRSTGGAFELSGTIGQPDAGVMAGGRYELTGGFWFALERGDCNEDGGVGLLDHAGLVECLTGPGSLPASGCRCLDLDRNDTVDLADVAAFHAAFTSEPRLEP